MIKKFEHKKIEVNCTKGNTLNPEIFKKYV